MRHKGKIILIVPKGLKITLGDVMNGEVGAFTVTLLLILVFTVRGWKVGIIIAMAAGTIIGIPMGLTGVPEHLVSMLTGMKDLDYTSAVEYLPAFIAIVGTAYTYNLATGLSLGIIAHIIVMVSAGRIRQVHWTSYVLAVPLAYYLVRLA